MVTDGQRLGEDANLWREPVRKGERQGLLDHDLLGVGSGRGGGEPDRVHLLPAAEQRQGHDLGARGKLSPGLGPVTDHPAGELVAEDDPLVRSHEAVVTGLRENVGLLVRVMAGM